MQPQPPQTSHYIFASPCYETRHCHIKSQSFDKGTYEPQNPNPNNNCAINKLIQNEGVMVPNSEHPQPPKQLEGGVYVGGGGVNTLEFSTSVHLKIFPFLTQRLT